MPLFSQWYPLVFILGKHPVKRCTHTREAIELRFDVSRHSKINATVRISCTSRLSCWIYSTQQQTKVYMAGNGYGISTFPFALNRPNCPLQRILCRSNTAASRSSFEKPECQPLRTCSDGWISGLLALAGVTKKNFLGYQFRFLKHCDRGRWDLFQKTATQTLHCT